MSLAAELHNAHKARLAAIAARAAEHQASKEPKPKPEPKPEPIEDGWVEKQITKHKPVWFSVISATKLTPKGRPTIRTIQRATCDVYGVKLNDILSARRNPDVVRPRMVSMYLAKELTSLSTIRIGRATGGRDHSTAINAIRRIEALLKSDENLDRNIKLIRERLA